VFRDLPKVYQHEHELRRRWFSANEFALIVCFDAGDGHCDAAATTRTMPLRFPAVYLMQ